MNIALPWNLATIHIYKFPTMCRPSGTMDYIDKHGTCILDGYLELFDQWRHIPRLIESNRRFR